ncbi:hypothetical protein LOK49_LG07G03362 [Camellia lanceoleosa]|uniref:Uncharacterized protein n=1 Tax=Camellia lanceoleosa TaxID=1840588 RepID=A0ACC0H0N3_9ERIC|nr:hypothetical protein LOK49_LG07G03362 [Camellia lanceoleosa]
MGIKRSKSLANRTKNCYKKSIQQPLKVPDFGPGPINSPPSEKIKKGKMLVGIIQWYLSLQDNWERTHLNHVTSQFHFSLRGMM